MCLSIYLYENLVQVPLPVRIRSHPTDPVSSYLSSKHRTKSIPPKPNRFMTYANTSFVQRSYTLRSEGGNRTYSITAKRMISGLVLKYLNGECFVIRQGYETARPASSSFCLTVPNPDIHWTRIGTRRLFQQMSERRIYNYVQHSLMTSAQSVVHIGGISRSIACIASTIKSSRHL